MRDGQNDRQTPDGTDTPEAPDKIRRQEPKNSPEPGGTQVPNINPPSVQPGHRDREQI